MNISEQKRLFQFTLDTYYSPERTRQGIGTLREKSLHNLLKYYIEPNEHFHEIPVGRFVADIKNEAGIYEIQTSSFSRLNPKLEKYLDEYKVTVVFPLIRNLRIVWINPETGEISKSRISSKHQNAFTPLYELWSIKDYISHPNFSFRVIELDCEQYRLENGEGKLNHKGAEKLDYRPTELVSDTLYSSPDELKLLCPALPSEAFTTSDFRKITKLKPLPSGACLKTVQLLGIVEVVGKDGRKNLYKATATE